MNRLNQETKSEIRNVSNYRRPPAITHSESRKVNIAEINKTFDDMMPNTRNSEYNESMKLIARKKIIEKFKSYGLDVFEQHFTVNLNGTIMNGVNVIAVRAGKKRGKCGDRLLVIGAHYDTVKGTFGVEDNGSGVVGMFEIARILRFRKKSLKYTIMFVAFDLEEDGLIGSQLFVVNYLIPSEINRNVKFIGAFILEMVLVYNDSPNSQYLSPDIVRSSPRVVERINKTGNRGNFVAIWKRDFLDNDLWKLFNEAWDNVETPSKYNLYPFSAPFPLNASVDLIREYPTFIRSDHAPFWHLGNGKLLPALLITDMGFFREPSSNGYHNWGDNKTQLTSSNLQFLKHTVEVLVQVLNLI
ncbi:hypothetical protein B4U80_01527 [Leptotrombidium deliense]|uniref:Peptidase M28 domain-containing protein n=1 Tax=Leptotrombidium deliense TaxID=299467 RepID=A0A443S4V0_9ACAR|nr:hypothetical protein B4U80_01527 [Leptotrombidium deliense]